MGQVIFLRFLPSLNTVVRELVSQRPRKVLKKGYELARGKRITVGPYTANYKKGSDMRKVLEATILKMGLEIAENQRKDFRPEFIF